MGAPRYRPPSRLTKSIRARPSLSELAAPSRVQPRPCAGHAHDDRHLLKTRHRSGAAPAADHDDTCPMTSERVHDQSAYRTCSQSALPSENPNIHHTASKSQDNNRKLCHPSGRHSIPSISNQSCPVISNHSIPVIPHIDLSSARLDFQPSSVLNPSVRQPTVPRGRCGQRRFGAVRRSSVVISFSSRRRRQQRPVGRPPSQAPPPAVLDITALLWPDRPPKARWPHGSTTHQ